MKFKNLFKGTLYAIAISLFFTVFALIGKKVAKIMNEKLKDKK